MRYVTTILLGAFLLFQVQPQIARVILPWFGGGPAVWSACLLFFQVGLLAGYGYAYALHRWCAPRTQAVVHGILLAASLLLLPVSPGVQWKPMGAEDPTLHILLLLSATVGLPYVLLAATGPIVQAWFAREFPGRSPYKLYALSNFGSLVALLSFPFVFEPHLTIGTQADAWALCYLGFALFCGWCAWSSARAPAVPIATVPVAAPVRPVSAAREPEPLARPRTPDPLREAFDGVTLEPAFARELSSALAAAAPRRRGADTGSKNRRVAAGSAGFGGPGPAEFRRWIGLAAIPSVLLLAVTNRICVDVAVVPFFWVMPLALYLLTFILTFESERWYRPRWMGAALALLAVLLLFFAEASWYSRSVAVQATTSCLALFLGGMVCHGELVRQKPAPAHLTAFYLALATGGALGGAFVAVVAPVLFDSYLELELGWVACVVVGALAWAKSRPDALAMVGVLTRRVLPFAVGIGAAAVVVLYARADSACIERSRNFFGRITVQQEVVVAAPDHPPGPDGTPRVLRRTRRLRHGSTLHGEQISGDAVDPRAGHTYFGQASGVALALTHHVARSDRPLRVGVIGLGTGTLAAYAQRGDAYTFFEIDPAIARVAEAHFTYLGDARRRGATVRVGIGDARIGLERALARGRPHRFDVLVVDAFSSDAIPVHLLTREASRTYWRHLAPDGILLTHVSNRHLRLLPVVRGLARDAGKQIRVVRTRAEEAVSGVGSVWAMVTGSPAFFRQRDVLAASSGDFLGDPPSLLWTDDFSSLWHVLR